MSRSLAAGSEAPANELEALVADLAGSGSVVFVFGVGWLTTHLRGLTRPLFRGSRERRWWHVDHGEPASRWALDVRLDQIEGVRFIREPNPFPSFPGEESLMVCFDAAGDQSVLACYLDELYEGQRLRPERVRQWEDLRRRHGGRDASVVVDGSLRPVVAAG